MWVSQTYLAIVEPDAKAYVYYLFEDYDSMQVKFTESVQRELEALGGIFGGDVSLMMPNPRAAKRIEAEVLTFEQGRWNWDVKAKLPALLITRKPLVQLASTDDVAILPFAGRKPKDVALVMVELRRTLYAMLRHDKDNAKPAATPDFLSRLQSALEIKVPLLPFVKVDLRQLFEQKR